MITLKTFKTICKSDDDILEGINLGDQYCGLFRCPLNEAPFIMPDLDKFFTDACKMLLIEGHDPAEWELDLKIHMLMENQYPCIPNWHCDNVPRVDGKTNYDQVKNDAKPMYLWLSSSPTTQFLKYDLTFKDIPRDHSHVSNMLRDNVDPNMLTKAPAKTWISMDQHTPHRGTLSTEKCWRVFARLTHNSITPVRPVNNYIRRHCQVYLDSANFSW